MVPANCSFFMDVVYHVECSSQKCEFMIHFLKQKVFLLFYHNFFFTSHKLLVILYALFMLRMDRD